MKIFDLRTMKTCPYDERDKNVFFKTQEFKTRIIELPSGGEMPECKMASHVIFYFISGEAEVKVNGESVKARKGMCVISDPALISMKTDTGAKIMGIQIEKK